MNIHQWIFFRIIITSISPHLDQENLPMLTVFCIIRFEHPQKPLLTPSHKPLLTPPPHTQTATDPTTPERPNEQSTRRISKTGKKKSTASKKSTTNSSPDWSLCRKRPSTVPLQLAHEDYLVDAISSKYTEFWNNYGKKRKSSIKGDEKRVRKEHVEEIAELEKRLTKKFKYVSEENFQEHMQKQLDTIGETGFTMDQMTTTLSMGGLYKQ